jgi:hypothetical protein
MPVPITAIFNAEPEGCEMTRLSAGCDFMVILVGINRAIQADFVVAYAAPAGLDHDSANTG